MAALGPTALCTRYTAAAAAVRMYRSLQQRLNKNTFISGNVFIEHRKPGQVLLGTAMAADSSQLADRRYDDRQPDREAGRLTGRQTGTQTLGQADLPACIA